MHHLDVLKIAKLGANIVIGYDSKIHHLDAINIIKEAVANGGTVTIEKKYHHLEIQKMVEIAGNKLTVKV